MILSDDDDYARPCIAVVHDFILRKKTRIPSNRLNNNNNYVVLFLYHKSSMRGKSQKQKPLLVKLVIIIAPCEALPFIYFTVRILFIYFVSLSPVSVVQIDAAAAETATTESPIHCPALYHIIIK